MTPSKNSEEIITEKKFIDLLKEGEGNFSEKIFNFEINHDLLINIANDFEKKKTTEKTKGIFRDKEDKTTIVVKLELDFSDSIFQEKVDFSSIKFLKEVKFDKAEFKKEVDFHRTKFNKEVSFEKVEFVNKTDFTKVEFKEEADFIGANFKEKVCFLEVDFLNETYFTGAEFEGEVNFKEAIFSEQVAFTNITFKKEACFEEAEFLKITDFSQTEFKEKVKFKEAEFLGGIDFTKTKFKKEVNFKKAIFLSKNDPSIDQNFLKKIGIDKHLQREDYKKIQFTKEAVIFKKKFIEKLNERGNFKNRIFDFKINRALLEKIFSKNPDKKICINRELNFTGAIFKEKIDFTDTEFKEKVNFRKAVFKNKAIFSDVEFSNTNNEVLETTNKTRHSELDRYIAEVFREKVNASFEKVIFEKEARFKKTKFLGNTNFYKTNFKDKASFLEAEFKKETHFGQANFESIVHFGKAQLLEDTDFTFTVFKGLTTFRDTKFVNKLSFYKTKFAEHVNFNDSQFKDCSKEAVVFGKTEFSKELDFENITIKGDNPLRFNSVIFSRRYLTDFCEINEKKKIKVSGEKEPALLIFEDISFPSEFVFSRCRLAKTKFLDCIIEKAKFLNCHFSIKGHFPFNRDSFYFKEKEENKPNKKNIWDKIETYLKLLKSYLKFSLVWLVIVQILLLFFPKIIEMWLSPYTIIITIVGIFFSLIHLRLEKRIVKFNSLLVVFGALFSAGILLSCFPDIPFGNITTGLPFSISFFIIVVLFCCSLWERVKNQKKEPSRQDREQLSRQMKSSLEASKSWKQAGDFYIDELELRRNLSKIYPKILELLWIISLN